MQEDFHYYATYCAAYLAGYNHEESLTVCYSAQLVDLFSKTLLIRLKGPLIAATTQLQMELMDARTDTLGLQDITRIWSAFHFLPRDLYACTEKKKTKRYMRKYRLICGPDGDLAKKTVELAKDKSLQAAGIAMHVLADTWAHMNFAGTPSLVINNTDDYFYELLDEGERQVHFRHKAFSPDDPEKGIYTNSLYQNNENSIMNLGHGRAGHFPDYSFARYKYMPAWGDYEEFIKDNPKDYMKAFCQMVCALKYIMEESDTFEPGQYEPENIAEYRERIEGILKKRQINASADWKEFARELSGEEIEDFNLDKYQDEYMTAEGSKKDETFLGLFIKAAIDHKVMVTDEIFRSGNMLAGYSLEYYENGFRSVKSYMEYLEKLKDVMGQEAAQ